MILLVYGGMPAMSRFRRSRHSAADSQASPHQPKKKYNQSFNTRIGEDL